MTQEQWEKKVELATSAREDTLRFARNAGYFGQSWKQTVADMPWGTSDEIQDEAKAAWKAGRKEYKNGSKSPA